MTQLSGKTAEKSLAEIMSSIGSRARSATQTLALADTEEKNTGLQNAANELRAAAGDIIEANRHDLAEAEKQNVGAARLDRIMLDAARLETIANAVEAIIALPDPVGTVLAGWQVPSGLDITRVRVPLGVTGVIYESRPNVTADAAALCLKAGNAVILRGSSEIVHSARAIHACFSRGLEAAGLEAQREGKSEAGLEARVGSGASAQREERGRPQAGGGGPQAESPARATPLRLGLRRAVARAKADRAQGQGPLRSCP